ncbi:MAG: hypothetical protein OEL83_13645 [Desulforhopalus sp.]|nr:hypothetical protein [Desulforhopalus sp.]
MLGRRTLIVTGYHLATLALLPLLVYFVTLEKQLNTVIFTPHIVAPTNDIFSVYWPNITGNYDQARAAGKTYPAGESKPELILRSFLSNHLLRIDPMTTTGSIVLHGLTIERFGVQRQIDAHELAKHLAKSVDATVRDTGSGLAITSTSRDPQLFLKDLPLPLPSLNDLVILAFLAVFLFSAFVFAGRRYLKSPPEQVRLYLFIAPALLVLLSFAFHWPLPVSFIACGLLFLAGQHTVIALVFSQPKRPSLKQCRAMAFIACFLGLLYYPLWLTLHPSKAFLGSMQELAANQKNAKEPRRFDDIGKKIIKGTEDNLVRHFSFREKLINLNANIKIFGLGFSPSSKAILGQNGMFFEGYGERRIEEDITAQFDNVTDYMGLIPFNNEELEAWRVCLEERYYWLKARGIDYVFALAPSKAMIYPENLPVQILKTKQALNKPTRFDQLSSHLKQHSSVPFVDLSEALLLAKQQAQTANTAAPLPLYYRTDFHWTYYGAFIAYRALIEEIQRRYPAYSFEPSPLSDFTIKVRPDWVHAPFVYALGLNPVLHRNETYLTFMPRPHSIYTSISDFATKGIDDKSIPEHVYNNYGGMPTATRELNNPHGKATTIFVIGDSFSEKYFGFFSAHAQKTVNFRIVYNFFTKPFEQYAPQLVVQEVLNMYLLQKPPTNPPEIRQERIKALTGKTEPADNAKG